MRLLPHIPFLLPRSDLPPRSRLPRPSVQVPEPSQEAGLRGANKGTTEDPPVPAYDGGQVPRCGGHACGPGLVKGPAPRPAPGFIFLILGLDILDSFDCLGSKIGNFIQDMKPAVWSNSAK